jgi:spermidine synthase/predicted MFS family arabinose efflux permease
MPRARIISVGFIVFAANAALLVLQLIAGRLLSPYIGVSLETWTAVIGVFLTGISLGNFFGGKLADRAANNSVLGALLLAGAVCTAAMLMPLAAMRAVPLGPRIALAALAICLPVSFVLSMITPVAIRALLPDVSHTGRVVGLVYSLGTVGSLAGNFLSGYVLIAHLTTTTIVLACAGLLAALGVAAFLSRSDRAAPATETTLPRVAPGTAKLSLWAACTIVFIASFCSMALEICASRLLAPVVGVSLYSWTGIIGVVLVGIAAGNYAGGRLADRSPHVETLGSCLFFGGLFAMIALLLYAVLLKWGVIESLGLIGQIVAWAAALFLVPMYLLATISPLVTRLTVGDLEHAGRIAGRIYAWSCVGAIAGTFATGWGLIALLWVKYVILVLAAVLILLSLVVGRPWKRPAELFGCAVVLGAAIFGLIHKKTFRPPDESEYYNETNYYTIRVYDARRSEQDVKALSLDHLQHSFVKLDDPTYLGYEHEYVQAEFARLASEQSGGGPRILVIGGGGYTFPRWAEATIPGAHIDVAEIDPGVTEAAHAAMGLRRDTRIVSHHMDGRQFVEERAPKGAYQLIIQDAVNDLSVPYHIMTREYNDAIKALLAPDGVYLLTVIDRFEEGQLMRSAVRTMKQTFAHVGLVDESEVWNTGNGEPVGQHVWVIYGSQRPFDLPALQSAVKKQTGVDARTVAMSHEQLDAYVAAGPPIVLTDTYAPVENLIAIVFRLRYK